jgi:threonine/homoserine/homoserine lactone efflux protein
VDISFFFKGVLLGLSIAAPVGVIGTLCIRRTLAEGRLVGLVSGLGAATADGIYGAIAGFGLTVITSVLISQQGWFKLIGGLFLLYLGLKTFLSKPAAQGAPVSGKGLFGAYTSTFFLTLTNPITIFSFIGIFGSMGLNTAGPDRDIASTILLVIGVPLGSALWWLILSTGVSLFQSRFTPTALQWVNRFAGILIIAFGVAALASLITSR